MNAKASLRTKLNAFKKLDRRTKGRKKEREKQLFSK